VYGWLSGEWLSRKYFAKQNATHHLTTHDSTNNQSLTKGKVIAKPDVYVILSLCWQIGWKDVWTGRILGLFWQVLLGYWILS